MTNRTHTFATSLEYTSRDDKGRYIFSKYGSILTGSVLDIGCSREKSLRGELPSGTRYLGVDIVPEADVIVDLERTDRLPFRDASFDTVICTEVLEHLENFHLILSEVVRVTRKYIIISLPNAWRSLWKSLVLNRPYQGAIENSSNRWLKFYGIPFRKPQDRHKWFFSFSEAEIYFREFARENNLEILSLDGGVLDEEGLKEDINRILENFWGIRVAFDRKLRPECSRLALDLKSATLWIAMQRRGLKEFETSSLKLDPKR